MKKKTFHDVLLERCDFLRESQRLLLKSKDSTSDVAGVLEVAKHMERNNASFTEISLLLKEYERLKKEGFAE